MTDLTELLSRKADDIKPPPQLPAGSYLFRVKGFKADRKSQAGNGMVDFDVEAVQPIDGVDPAQMEGVELPYTMRHTFVVTDKSLFRLRDFCTNALGIPTEGRALQDVLSDSPGHAFRGNVTHRPNQQDPTRFYAEISEAFAAE